MSEYGQRIAVVGLLIVALTVGLAFELNSALPGENMVRTFSPSTQTSTIRNAVMVSANTSSVSAAGLRLSTFINASDIKIGQRLNISVSLFNTVPTATSLWGLNAWSPSQERNWTFFGVQVATWPECTDRFPFGWPFPIEILVLKGNYTVQGLSSSTVVPLSFTCGAIGATSPHFTFGPNSDLVNMTYVGDGGVGIQQLGLYHISSSFTVDGYWNLTGLAEQANSSAICIPAVPSACEPPSSTPFDAGVYTIGVTDEWGQVNVLHFQVNGFG